VTRGWRKPHDEKLCDLYSSPNIIRIIKSRRIGWTGYIARMKRRGTFIGYWQKSRRERHRWVGNIKMNAFLKTTARNNVFVLNFIVHYFLQVSAPIGGHLQVICKQNIY
jgi:hypothetical protein